MDRKRIAVIVGTVVGTLSLASAAGAANFGLLRSSSDDPAPAVGNLDAGTVADASTSSSSSAVTTAGSTSTVVTVPGSVDPSASAPTSVDDHGGRGDDDVTTSTPTVVGTFQPPAVTTDDHGGSNSGSGSDSSGPGGSGSDSSGSGSSGSGHGGGDDD